MRHILLILLLFLGACSLEQANETLSTPEERALAFRAANAIIARDFNTLDEMVYPPFRDELTPEAFAKWAAMAPKGKITLHSVNVLTETENGISTTLKSFNYEVGSGERWAVLQVTLRTSPRPALVAGFRIWPADRSPSAANNLDSAKMGPIHYGWTAAMLLAFATTLTAFVLVLTTRGMKRKWLWAIGCLFSFVTFQLNWTTGEWGVMPISFLLFGAGAVRAGPFAPWVMQFAIPVVAIVFLIRRASGAWQADPDEAAEPFI